MDITFRTKKLSKTCNDSTVAIKQIGPEQARRLRQRLDELLAAGSLSVMASLPGRTHELAGDRKGQLSIDLKHPYRLIFAPAHLPLPTKPDGGLDWSRVTAVEIIEITDTHD